MCDFDEFLASQNLMNDIIIWSFLRSGFIYSDNSKFFIW